MALTPVEIRHLTPQRTLFRGYKAAATPEPEADPTEERSWYGLPDANAA